MFVPVMVRVSVDFYWLDFAMIIMTMFARSFEFDSGVANIMFFKFLANRVFNFRRVAFGDDMKCSVVMETIHAPDVDMVNILDTFNF